MNGNFYKKREYSLSQKNTVFYMVYANGCWNLWHLMFVASRKKLSPSVDSIYGCVCVRVRVRVCAGVCVCVCVENEK